MVESICLALMQLLKMLLSKIMVQALVADGVTNGSPIIDGAIIENNIAYWGGGIYFENAEPAVKHSILRRNESY